MHGGQGFLCVFCRVLSLRPVCSGVLASPACVWVWADLTWVSPRPWGSCVVPVWFRCSLTQIRAFLWGQHFPCLPQNFQSGRCWRWCWPVCRQLARVWTRVGGREPRSEAVAAERTGAQRGRGVLAAWQASGGGHKGGAAWISPWTRPRGRHAHHRLNRGVLVACGPRVLVPGRPRPRSSAVDLVRTPRAGRHRGYPMAFPWSRGRRFSPPAH